MTRKQHGGSVGSQSSEDLVAVVEVKKVLVKVRMGGHVGVGNSRAKRRSMRRGHHVAFHERWKRWKIHA